MLFDYIRKSIYLITHERLTSPISGSFILSWIVWNWKAIYYLFFETSIPVYSKFVFINNSYIDVDYNLIYPLLSTIFFVGVYPLITTGGLYAWLQYKKWQTSIKNKIEGQELLTTEQSRAIRLEIAKQANYFDELMKSKDEEASRLKLQLNLKDTEIGQLTTQINEFAKPGVLNKGEKASLSLDNSDQISETLELPSISNALPSIIDSINRVLQVPNSDARYYLLAGGFIAQHPGRVGDYYLFTEKGNKLVTKFYQERL
jgi:hypothetical protein